VEQQSLYELFCWIYVLSEGDQAKKSGPNEIGPLIKLWWGGQNSNGKLTNLNKLKCKLNIFNKLILKDMKIFLKLEAKFILSKYNNQKYYKFFKF